MKGFLLPRLGMAVLVMLGVCLLVFLLLHLAPGDPVDIMLGESARPADREALRAALGLDQPLGKQLQAYLAGLLRLDLGQSIHYGRPVIDILLERLPATVQLALAALGIALMIAIPLGALAALRQDSAWDRLAMGLAVFGTAIPNFWLGPLLILLFSLHLGWLPVSGREETGAWVLPALTLGTALAAVLARVTRANLLEVLREDHIRTARAKGLPESRVIWRHGLRCALLPLLTVLGLQLGILLGGAVVTEVVFAWPGLGSLVVEAIQRRDYPLVQGAVLLIALTYVLVNLATDLSYAWADPRIRLGGRATE